MILSEVEKELFNPVRASLSGQKTYIKNPLNRMEKIFNFYPAQYTVIGASSGLGKTSLTDHFLLSIVDSKPKDLHIEVLYYSMERKKKFKYAKWISWKMFKEEKLRHSMNTLTNRNGKMDEKLLHHMDTKYKGWLEDVLSHIDLRDGTRNVKEIEADITRMASRLGLFVSSDTNGVYINGKFQKAFQADTFVETKYGKRLYAKFKHNGQEHVIYQNDRLYLTDKPVMVFIVVDHVGKVRSDGRKKDTLDALDQVLADARDMYGFSPIAISQFNRSIGSTDRRKMSGSDLFPTLEDFKDTNNIIESADLVLAMFDPSKYKTWDKEGMAYGYCVRDSTVTSLGQQRMRYLHVLKNSFGITNTLSFLRFTGEVGYFDTFPKEADLLEVSKVYAEISQGL